MKKSLSLSSANNGGLEGIDSENESVQLTSSGISVNSGEVLDCPQLNLLQLN